MFLLADTLLEGHLRDFVAERREAGQSWRTIARALWEATDRKVDVTHQTLANWFAEEAA